MFLLTGFLTEGFAGGRNSKRSHSKNKSHSKNCSPRFFTKAQTLSDQYIMLVQQEVRIISEPAYEIKMNEHFYYVEGVEGLKHEIKAAQEVSHWLQGKTNLSYLHIPSLNGAAVPSVDGTLFRDSVLYPKARVSLKSIFGDEDSLDLSEKVQVVVMKALVKDKKFNNFKSNFYQVMKRENEKTLSRWLQGNAPFLKKDATNMSILGFKLSKAPPLVVVVKLENRFDQAQVIKTLERMQEKLSEIKESDLYSVLLINGGEIYEVSRPSRKIKNL